MSWLQFNSRTRQVVNKETPSHWRLLPKTCCSMFRRSQSTNFTCAMSQAMHILNICKTFHEIQVPLNFFKFTGINLVQLNINPVEFHLIQLCSFCNIYMSNDVKFFKTPCTLFVFVFDHFLQLNIKVILNFVYLICNNYVWKTTTQIGMHISEICRLEFPTFFMYALHKIMSIFKALILIFIIELILCL